MSKNSRVTADPSISAIAAHRRAYMAFLSADGETAQSAYAVEKEALDRLLRTKPTTIAGAAVLLRYVLRHNEEECGRLTDKFEDHDNLLDFLETLADGLEALATSSGRSRSKVAKVVSSVRQGAARGPDR